ncbi:MAG: hypothetical protein M1836_003285 [Candelina mexicana]|nr:MAG: hypothetical protein M1836_003285 [Candelina mexicana]
MPITIEKLRAISEKAKQITTPRATRVMLITQSYLSVLIISAYINSSDATPYGQQTVVLNSIVKRATSSDPSIQAKRYFTNCDGYLEREKTASDDANKLANAADKWQPGKNYQDDATLWFGKDSIDNNFAIRIANNFRNAMSLHDRNWIWPEAQLLIYCNEFPQLPPPADGYKDKKPGCTRGTNAYSFIKKGWFHNGYYVVFCQPFWKIMRSLDDIKNFLDFPETKEYRNDASFLNKVSRGQTYLHELMHLTNLIGGPQIEDLVAGNGKVYGATRCAKLAQDYGCENKTSHIAWGTTLNSDNYAHFGISTYFRQQYQLNAPPAPPKGWEKTPRMDPPDEKPKPAIVNINGDPGVDATEPSVIPPESLPPGGKLPAPVSHPPPPSPPNCTPSQTGTDPSFANNLAGIFCDTKKTDFSKDQSKTLTGKDLSPPTDNYSAIKVQFEFKKANEGECALSCADTYEQLISTCQYDSHTVYGQADVSQACGNYKFSITPAK